MSYLVSEILNYAILASRLTNISKLNGVWFDYKSCMLDISHVLPSHSQLPPQLAQTSAYRYN